MHQILIPAFEGSNPSSPSIFHYEVARALLGSDAQKCRKRQVPLAHAMRNNLLAGHSPLGTDASRRPFALETKDAWGPVVAVARARQQPLTTAPEALPPRDRVRPRTGVAAEPPGWSPLIERRRLAEDPSVPLVMNCALPY